MLQTSSNDATKTKDQPLFGPWKITEQVLLEGISENLREEKLTGNSQHEFTKGKLCLNNLFVSCDKMTRLVGKGRVVICF